MKKLTIALVDMNSRERNFFMHQLPGHTYVTLSSHLSSRNASQIRHADVVVHFIHSAITQRVLDALPRLKLLVTLSTGYDHIDLGACQQRQIRVTNVPTYGANTVAEHTFALLLGLSHKLLPSVLRTRHDDFRFSDSLTGFDLAGKTLGVIGVGSIGTHVVRIGRGFGMHVLGYSRHCDKKLAQQSGFQCVSLRTLLRKSDVISLHVPLTKETYHLIGKREFSLMKKGVILLNTARGALIDTSSLVAALHHGIVGGAGLDVLESENCLEERQGLSLCEWRDIAYAHELMHRDNVLITPHNAFNTLEAINRILLTGVKNIKGFLSQRKVNVVV